MFQINNKLLNVLSRFCLSLIFISVFSPAVSAKEVLGWVETVKISAGNTLIKAKVDTGADSSSLHCECITPYDRNGESWVKFTVTDVEGDMTSYEKKILRTVKVKRHFGDVQKRYVVRMGICIGSQYGETDVSLVDRSGFNYDLLIGRKYLKDKFIVDPAKTFTASPHCKSAAE